jgi:hypothetical protein
MYLDLGGGNRIPKISERTARSVAELRAAGVGVDRVAMLHDGSPASSDLFQAVLTMLDPQVMLALIPIISPESGPLNGRGVLQQDQERAKHLGRALKVLDLPTADGPSIVTRLREDQYDLAVVPLPGETTDPLTHVDERGRYLVTHAHCRVCLISAPGIPPEVVDSTPSAR